MVKVRFIEIVTNCHATEDPEKVKKAIFTLLPEKLKDKIVLEEHVYKGYYGNPIVRFHLKIKSSRDSESVIKYIANKMDEISKKLLNASLDLRLASRGKLHLRFSKQEAYMGKIVLEDSDDVIKVVIAFQIKDIKELEKYLKEIGMI